MNTIVIVDPVVKVESFRLAGQTCTRVQLVVKLSSRIGWPWMNYAPLILMVLWSSLTGAFAASAETPNILLIFSDDQGFHDVGCYGSEIETRHLDRLAAGGMRFTQFYAASSICTPSRYGLLTGRYAHRSADQLTSALMFLAQEDKSRGLRAGETTYVTRLQEAGYRTALVGKWHLGHGEEMFWPTRHGFDSFFGHTGGCVDFFTLDYGNRPDWYRGRQLVRPNGYATDVITNEAIGELARAKQDGRPFYLHVAYNAPHFGKGWDAANEETVNVMQPRSEDLKRVEHLDDPLRRAFAAKVVGMDEGVGRLLDALERHDLDENTLVIFMTDHGGDPDYGGSNLPFRGGKATLYEGGIRVPCIVRWPQHVAPQSVCDDVACAVDWYATFGQIVGYGSGQTDGRSIENLLLGNPAESPRTLVWKTGAHRELGRQSWQAVRDGDWKWVKAPDREAELFDLNRDPRETVDRSGELPEVARRLAALAEQS